jgi:hypothetical protein
MNETNHNRQQAHEAAQSAWDDYEAHRALNDRNRRADNPGIHLPPRHGRAKSPTGGLGEARRAERAAAGPLTAEQAAKALAKRQAHKAFLKAQAKKTRAANTSRVPAVSTGGDRYFPHQGVREVARRVRQAAAIADRGLGGTGGAS